MTQILQIKSSILAGNAQSSALSEAFVRELGGTVVTRDVSAEPLPYFDFNAATALRGTPETDAERAILALSDRLIAELNAAEVVVINAPMYNFSIPAQLKSYFDFIARAGVTFRYGEKGAEGLVTGKKVVVILTSGGKHAGGAVETMKAYLRDFLGFLGMTDVQFAYAEGLNMGEEAAALGKAQAQRELAAIAKTL